MPAQDGITLLNVANVQWKAGADSRIGSITYQGGRPKTTYNQIDIPFFRQYNNSFTFNAGSPRYIIEYVSYPIPFEWTPYVELISSYTKVTNCTVQVGLFNPQQDPYTQSQCDFLNKHGCYLYIVPNGSDNFKYGGVITAYTV